MPEPELSLLFVRPLNQIGAHYIVTGSVAAILYGKPRLTNDVDFVVFQKFFRKGGSEKHLRDIRAMPAVSSDLVNLSELEEWIVRRELAVEWNRINVPP